MCWEGLPKSFLFKGPLASQNMLSYLQAQFQLSVLGRRVAEWSIMQCWRTLSPLSLHLAGEQAFYKWDKSVDLNKAGTLRTGV